MKFYVTWGSRHLICIGAGPFEACMKTFQYFLGTKEANADKAATRMRVSERGFTRRDDDVVFDLEEVINTLLLEQNLDD